MSIVRELLKKAAEHVVEEGAKVLGTAIGTRIGNRINPPAPEPAPKPEEPKP